MTSSPSASPAAPRIELDLRGLKCPLPALRTRRALAALPAGATLLVSATDPMAAIDIPHLLRETGDRLSAVLRDGDVMTFEIERAGQALRGDAEA